jgi:hypothetical protein
MTDKNHRVQEVSCEGKEQLTQERAQAIQRRPSDHNRGRTAYHCKFCGWWHLGSSQSIKKPMRRVR